MRVALQLPCCKKQCGVEKTADTVPPVLRHLKVEEHTNSTTAVFPANAHLYVSPLGLADEAWCNVRAVSPKKLQR